MGGSAVARRVTRAATRGMGAARCGAVVAVAVAMGCDGVGEANGGATFVVADSAGVEIAFSDAPTWGEGSPWSVSDEPRLTIGEGGADAASGGDEAYALSFVGWPRRLSNGSVAVPNSGSGQVKTYDAEGRHLRDLGRRGQGPGEFRRVRSVFEGDADSLIAADGPRLTWFAADGTVGRTLTLSPPEGGRQAFAMRPFEDGTVLGQSVVSGDPPRTGLFDGGVREIHLFDATGVHLGRIGAVPHADNWGFETGSGRGYTSVPFSVVFPPIETDGRLVYSGAGTIPEVEVRTPDGTLVRLVRWSVEPRQVGPAVADSFLEYRRSLDDSPEMRAMTEAVLDGIAFPERMPIYQSLRIDREGYLWVERFRPPWDDHARWWVFDQEGRWLGEAPVPPGVRLSDVGRDELVGILRDDFDVERVVVYELDRGRAGRHDSG